MIVPDVVVKVGGSLYDLPDLGPRLRSWLDSLETTRAIIVPGGGATADVIRDFDRIHGLGEDRAHWLALEAVRLNGRFLSTIVPRTRFVTHLDEAEFVWQSGCVAILDAYQFAVTDEGRPGSLPHVWTATSDAVAARVAIVTEARRLVMLKSTPLPPDISWLEAAERDLVDPHWPAIIAQAPKLKIMWVHWRGLT